MYFFPIFNAFGEGYFYDYAFKLVTDLLIEKIQEKECLLCWVPEEGLEIKKGAYIPKLDGLTQESENNYVGITIINLKTDTCLCLAIDRNLSVISVWNNLDSSGESIEFLFYYQWPLFSFNHSTAQWEISPGPATNLIFDQAIKNLCFGYDF